MMREYSKWRITKKRIMYGGQALNIHLREVHEKKLKAHFSAVILIPTEWKISMET